MIGALRTHWAYISVAILLLITFLQPFLGMRNFSPAYDEVAHLPSGYSYLMTHEIRLNPEHPPLIKILSALPLLFLHPSFVMYDKTRASNISDRSYQWVFGKQFLFSNDTERLLFWGRIPIILVSVLLGFYIFKFAAEMFSVRAGVVGLFLYTFMPNIIAHSQFVTTDLGVSAFSFITIYYLWKFFQIHKKIHLALAGIFLGLSLGSKFSAVILIPVVAILSLMYVWRSITKASIIVQCKNLLGVLFPIYAVGAVVVYVLYFCPSSLSFYWEGLRSVYDGVQGVSDPHYSYYLNGQFDKNGWWYYFLIAFVLKTPIPALIFFVVAVLLIFKYKISASDKSALLLPMIAFFVLAMMQAHDIGVRYILPAYPFLIAYSSGVIDFIGSLKPKHKILIFDVGVLLALWYVFGTVKIYPDYLAYFNESVGGPQNGYKYLDDSNIEWGQDLKRLRDYQKQYPDTKVVTSWGLVDPSYYGINNDVTRQYWWAHPHGRYAVSVQTLVRSQFTSKTYNESSLDWLSLYRPDDRIGYSFFVYDF